MGKGNSRPFPSSWLVRAALLKSIIFAVHVWVNLHTKKRFVYTKHLNQTNILYVVIIYIRVSHNHVECIYEDSVVILLIHIFSCPTVPIASGVASLPEGTLLINQSIIHFSYPLRRQWPWW